MIRVTVDWEQMRLEMSGHADTAPVGEDLVCCAASMALQMLVRACDVLGVKARCKLRSGRGMIQIMEDNPRIKERFYHTVDGLMWLEEQCPDGLKIEVK